MNRLVVAALRDRVAELVGSARASTLAEAITTRQGTNRFPPEYQAEVIVRRLRDSYFTVLQCLDSDTPNDVHLGIAAMAKARRILAVLTTNFDRALEAAFRKLDVPYDVNSHSAEFRTLADRFRDGGSDGPCPILKLHGSAEDPATLVDTLSQRKRGFPREVADCVRHLLRFGHWLFLGYSGADLMADENYLFLKPDAAEAKGFTWLLRTNTEPVPALSAIRAIYGNRAEIVHSELPGWLAEFSEPLLPESPPRSPALNAATVQEILKQAVARVAGYANSWAASERLDRNVLVFADLLEAVGEPGSSLELVQQLYDTYPPEDRRSGYFGIVIDTLANYYSRAGRFAEAIALFQHALALYDPATAEAQHLVVLNNLALVYEKQGQTGEALNLYERVLVFAERSGKADLRGVGLHNLAMVRRRLGETDQAERLYLQELEVVRLLGDEAGRAATLNNLGELAVSRQQFDRASKYLAEAVSVRDRIGDDLGAARSRANLANVYWGQKEYDKGLPLYEQSLDVFRRFTERVDIARTLRNIAHLKESIGKRDEALALLEEALAEATATRADPAQVLQLFGEIQQKQGRNLDSANTFLELIDLAARIRDAPLERDALMGRGIALKALNEFEPALLLLREALALTDRHGFAGREWVVEHLADALNREGLARQQRSDLDGALEHFLESLEIWGQRGSPYNEGQTLMNVGNIHVMRQEYVEAAADFQRAEAALLLANDRDGADNVALLSGELYLWLDRLDEASDIFRGVVNRATSYEERVDRMNRIGELAGKQLKRRAIDRALRVFKDCCEWNREDGYLPDAACLINIGSILKATGDAKGARSCFEEAVVLLKDQAQHPLLARAKALLSTDSFDE